MLAGAARPRSVDANTGRIVASRPDPTVHPDRSLPSAADPGGCQSAHVALARRSGFCHGRRRPRLSDAPLPRNWQARHRARTVARSRGVADELRCRSSRPRTGRSRSRFACPMCGQPPRKRGEPGSVVDIRADRDRQHPVGRGRSRVAAETPIEPSDLSTVRSTAASPERAAGSTTGGLSSTASRRTLTRRRPRRQHHDDDGDGSKIGKRYPRLMHRSGGPDLDPRIGPAPSPGVNPT